MSESQRIGEESSQNRSRDDKLYENFQMSDEVGQSSDEESFTISDEENYTSRMIEVGQSIDKEIYAISDEGGQSNDQEIFQIIDYQSSDEEIVESRVEESGQSSDEERFGEEKRCVLSDPAQPHNLSREAGYKTEHDCFSCGKINISWELDDKENFHYYCTICKVEFHRECGEYPSKMIHPYHPQHPLTFTFLDRKSETIVDTNYGEHFKFLHSDMSIEFHKTSQTMSSCNIMFDKCTWCGNDLGEWFYRCLISNFSLDLRCAMLNPPLTIQNPKSHHHSLSLFPQPPSFPCNACGLTNVMKPSFACYQCNYVVHQDCIELPRVIKITRHPHRLFHAPYLPTKVSSCRVCYKNVDIKYGQYSCNNEDCSYVAHSDCATHKTVWNKKELEWEPEESDEAINIEPPYKKIGDGLIEHFCHDHHYLKLEKYDGSKDSGKQCEACMRSITSHDFYNCIECDYFLHELCANLPRQMDHLLHIHSLFMDPYYVCHQDFDNLRCNICSRRSSGWKYSCIESECKNDYFRTRFQVDINCILVPECFTHESHKEHPLFISTTYIINGEILCQGCKKIINGYRLNCTICEFVLCYVCATIPKELYCKYDERTLSLCYGESGVDEKYWCELCETSLDPTEWFYTNDELCATIHLKCLFGDSAYMKSGHAFSYGFLDTIVCNASNTRRVCYACHQRCAHPVYYKVREKDEMEVDICSFSCLLRYCML